MTQTSPLFRLICISTFIFVTNQCVIAQDDTPLLGEQDQTQADSSLKMVDVMPEFPGGTAGLMQYMIDNVRYPQAAKTNNISGIVFAKFVIDKSGKVRDAEIMQGIGGGCDEEALRVVQSMPDWTPGEHDGQAVAVEFRLPVRFKFDRRKKKKKRKK